MVHMPPTLGLLLRRLPRLDSAARDHPAKVPFPRMGVWAARHLPRCDRSLRTERVLLGTAIRVRTSSIILILRLVAALLVELLLLLLPSLLLKLLLANVRTDLPLRLPRGSVNGKTMTSQM
jgi:hypothetical protein